MKQAKCACSPAKTIQAFVEFVEIEKRSSFTKHRLKGNIKLKVKVNLKVAEYMTSKAKPKVKVRRKT